MANDTETRPPLTPDEWEQWQRSARYIFPTTEEAPGGLMLNRPGIEVARRQAIAALCLYDQPFGFTHEDLAWLRQMEFLTMHRDRAEEHQRWFQGFLDRIAALLPPHDSDPSPSA